MRLWISILLRQPEVDDVDLIRSFSESHQKVIRLYIAMDETFTMHVLDPGHELIRQHQHRLQAQLSVTKVEQILQARSEQIHHHDVIITLHAVPSHVRDAGAALQDFIEFRFVE